MDGRCNSPDTEFSTATPWVACNRERPPSSTHDGTAPRARRCTPPEHVRSSAAEAAARRAAVTAAAATPSTVLRAGDARHLPLPASSAAHPPHRYLILPTRAPSARLRAARRDGAARPSAPPRFPSSLLDRPATAAAAPHRPRRRPARASVWTVVDDDEEEKRGEDNSGRDTSTSANGQRLTSGSDVCQVTLPLSHRCRLPVLWQRRSAALCYCAASSQCHTPYYPTST